MIDKLPLPDLHAKVMSTRYSLHSGSDQHDDFTCLVVTYQHNTKPDCVTELADVCDRRVQRLADQLPLDLIEAYGRLARLARWRAEQLNIAIETIGKEKDQ